LEAIEAVAPFDLTGITVNCSMPEAVTAAMPLLVDAFPMVGGYANGFQTVADLEAGGTTKDLKARKDLTPAAYAEYTLKWAKAGAKIIGGCCEITPAHIAEIDRVLRAAGYQIASF